MGTGASAGGVLIQIIVCRCNALIRCARLRHRSPLLISLGFCPCAKPRSVGADNSCIVVAVGRPLLPPPPSPSVAIPWKHVGRSEFGVTRQSRACIHAFTSSQSGEIAANFLPVPLLSSRLRRWPKGMIQATYRLSLHSHRAFPLSSSILLRSFSGLEKLLLALFYRMG